MLGRLFYRFVLFILCGIAVTGCQTLMPRQAETHGSQNRAVPNLVQGVCGDCHGVEPPFLSPNPNAPDFATIANRLGMSSESLSTWLVEAHNYPELMDFELSKHEAKETARYLISLQNEDHKAAR